MTVCFLYLIVTSDHLSSLEILMVEEERGPQLTISINRIPLEIGAVFFNEAVSFVPCFRYTGGQDVVLFTSPNIHYKVDMGGQFCTDYYGMKFELIECIQSEQVYVDLNDEHVFKMFKLSELITEAKLVFFAPHYLLQVINTPFLIIVFELLRVLPT